MSDQNIRSPICTILGNVDVGKTLLLDTIRDSKIGKSEAGGITQKIGVTVINKKILKKLTKKNIIIPSLMFIDTPGHECFTNQRLCGMEVSDIVIILVDIFKGIDDQTIKCLEMIKTCKVPFIVGINKIDRLVEWKNRPLGIIQKSLKKQKNITKHAFQSSIDKIKLQLAENWFNSELYYKNKNPREYVSIVPLSAKTGEGIPDLLMVMNYLATKHLTKRITFQKNIVKGYFLETLNDPKLGQLYTIIVTDGTLNKNDNILVSDSNGDVISIKIRQLFVSKAGKEIKDKLNVQPTTSLTCEPGLIKIDKNMVIAAAAQFYKADKNKEKYVKILEKKTNNSIHDIELDRNGVSLCTPTMGMMSALINICKTNDIPIKNIKIGNLTKKDVIKANSIEKFTDDIDILYYKRYHCILLFGQHVPSNIKPFVGKLKIISHQIIYRIIDAYEDYVENLNYKIRELYPQIKPIAEMKIFPEYVFMTKNPILVGVKVLKNSIHCGSIVCVDDKILGKVTSIQKNREPLEKANKNAEVCIKIIQIDNKKYEYGKDFNDEQIIKTYLSPSDQELMRKYKDVFYKVRHINK